MESFRSFITAAQKTKKCPDGYRFDERLNDREVKYPLICHAEENAIMHAARIGMSLKGCTVYVTWPPCTRCARSLIQAGISSVVYPEDTAIPERWMADFNLSLKSKTTSFKGIS